MIKVSIFESCYNPQAIDVVECEDWNEVVKMLRVFSEWEYDQKGDAPLIMTIKYTDDYRSQENAETLYAMLLDLDNGFESSTVIEICKDLNLAAVCYSTGSNGLKDKEKFRLVVPIAEPIKASLMPTLWDSMDSCFKQETDESKNNTESHFYVPGQYKGATNFIHELKGNIWSYEQWLENFPVQQSRKIRKPKRSKALQSFLDNQKRLEMERTQLTSSERIQQLPDVETKWEERYFDSSSGDRHFARFTFMLQCAGRARLEGNFLSAYELVQMYNVVDHCHPEGPRHDGSIKQKDCLKDAEKALIKA